MKKATPPLWRKDWFTQQWPGALAWASGWVLMLWLDGRLGLSSLAMLLVLTATIAALWLRGMASVTVCVVGVLAFNWLFVPPRYTFSIDLHQDATLLLVMFAVSVLVSFLMTALREHANDVEHHAQLLQVQRNFGDALRDAPQAEQCLPRLQQLLAQITAQPSAVLIVPQGLPATDDMDKAKLAGDVTTSQLSGLWHSMRSGHALGPGTTRYADMPWCFFPLRGRQVAYGAAMIEAAPSVLKSQPQLQALCDLMGGALERQHWQQQQVESAQAATEQELRATLLAAIAHDFRTPLASILGSASALVEQDARLLQLQRVELAQRIVDETGRLRRITANILELARLDAVGVHLHCDWQSAQELATEAVRRCREPQRVTLQLEQVLPLLWCDPLLVSQLLENLLDNACKYSPAGSPVLLQVRHAGDAVVFSVKDQGTGIPAELQQLIFQPFQQGQALALGIAASRRTGVGLGLALCRSVAHLHGGELRLQSGEQSTCFEFLLPHKAQPPLPQQEVQA